MRSFLSLFLFLSSVGLAQANGVTPVPEIDGLAGLSALAVIGSVAALFWERRRK